MIPVAIDRPCYHQPVVTYTIMIICTIVQIIRTLVPATDDWAVAYGYIPGHGSLLTLITNMFVHANFGHLLGNMLFLYITGMKVEDVLGPWRYALLYLASGVAACATFEAMQSTIPIPLIGASGAIAGMMGSFMVLFPFAEVKMIGVFMYRMFTFKIGAILYLGYWLLEQVAMMYFIGEEDSVAFAGHIGGFVAGAVWMWAFFGWNSGDELEREEPVFMAAR